ncbi:CPCC family cysteine-rich protein [Streptomyces sp. NPDC087270]|uniref:CPCC family cysteine-rich protein n=1 Tax=Streptomyces sp. NPDC087270 TaxID=3365774 RepID=UPI0037F4BA8A
MSDRYPFPCCGHRVLDEMSESFGICPVCFWEDDGVQFRPGAGYRPVTIATVRRSRRRTAIRRCFPLT